MILVNNKDTRGWATPIGHHSSLFSFFLWALEPSNQWHRTPFSSLLEPRDPEVNCYQIPRASSASFRLHSEGKRSFAREDPLTLHQDTMTIYLISRIQKAFQTEGAKIPALEQYI